MGWHRANDPYVDSSFLRSEIKGKVFLALVEFTERLASLLVSDCEDMSARLGCRNLAVDCAMCAHLPQQSGMQ